MRALLKAALGLVLLLGIAGAARAEIWRPAPETTFEWILDNYTGSLPAAAVIDADMFETKAATVAALHAAGKKAICYISFGSWENWRPDRNRFPASVIGKPYDGWKGERWLDIRRIAVLAPIFEARLNKCKAKGFDAVEPDNLDGYQNKTGFPLTRADQLRFLKWLANAAHVRGLSIGLKNVPEFIPQVLPLYDWALTEECYAQHWCGAMTPFIAANKAVFAVEYTDTNINFTKFCARAKALRLSPLLKRRALGSWSKRCPA
jgi:hypothetical protein